LNVFENRVLRRMLGPKRDEVAVGWRKLYNGELQNLYASPNIITVIKSWRIRWAVARMVETGNAFNILVGKSKGKRPLENLGVQGK
jgi:GH43 family beta-xylosidase